MIEVGRRCSLELAVRGRVVWQAGPCGRRRT